MTTCPGWKYSRSDDEWRLYGDSAKLRNKGKLVLADNARGRGSRYQQVFVKPGKKDIFGKKYSAAKIKKFKDTSASNWGVASSPYDNRAHHVLISELEQAWMEEDATNFKILNEGMWDQNNGENNIFLPHMVWLIEIHLLPLHRGPHRANYPTTYPHEKYRKDVQKILEDLRRSFKHAVPCREDDNNYTKVQNFLNNRIDVLWRNLAKCIYGVTLGSKDHVDKRKTKALETKTKGLSDWGKGRRYGKASYNK